MGGWRFVQCAPRQAGLSVLPADHICILPMNPTCRLAAGTQAVAGGGRSVDPGAATPGPRGTSGRIAAQGVASAAQGTGGIGAEVPSTAAHQSPGAALPVSVSDGDLLLTGRPQASALAAAVPIKSVGGSNPRRSTPASPVVARAASWAGVTAWGAGLWKQGECMGVQAWAACQDQD